MQDPFLKDFLGGYKLCKRMLRYYDIVIDTENPWIMTQSPFRVRKFEEIRKKPV